jgi:hypothetical protein
MGLIKSTLWGLLASKPNPSATNGTAMVMAAGERIFQRDGVNDELVQAVKVSLQNQRRRNGLRRLA